VKSAVMVCSVAAILCFLFTPNSLGSSVAPVNRLFYGILCNADITEHAQTKYMIAQDLREGCYSEDIFLLLRESRERRCGAVRLANGKALVCRACLTRVASCLMGFKSDFVGLGD